MNMIDVLTVINGLARERGLWSFSMLTVVFCVFFSFFRNYYYYYIFFNL